MESGQRTAMDPKAGSKPPPWPQSTAVKRILLIANETVAAPGAVSQVERLGRDGPAEVYVVAPALASSPLKLAAGEVDDAIGAARERVDAAVEMLREAGLKASGDVGESEPGLALEDALRRFRPDEVVIATHPPGSSKWLEQEVVEKARTELDVPVTHIVIDGGAGEVVGREHGHARVERPTATAYDLPRLPVRDVAAIAVGVLGTIVLGVLAILCAGDISQGGMSAGCAIRIGLAIAAFVVTVFHVLALFVFGTVRYRGWAERFAANAMLFAIPPAVVVSLIAG